MSYTAKQLFEKEKYSVCKVVTGDGSGTGYIVNLKKGIIITNAHVVKSQNGGVCSYCNVEIGGRSSGASVLAYGQPSGENDFAILRATSLPYYATEARMKRDYLPTHGENIFIIGHPLGASITITQGIVNNPSYDLGGNTFILTDTTVNPGNSGGPMYDENGYVIGTAVAKTTIKNVSNQSLILSMKQLAAFISASGIDIDYGPYPSSPKSVYVYGSYRSSPSTPSYPSTPSTPSYPSTPSAPSYPSTPSYPSMPSSPGFGGGSPFMMPPNNPFAMCYPVGMCFNMPGPYGYPVPMIVSAHVQCGGVQYIVFRMQTMQGFYLYSVMSNGALMPVLDQNLVAYIVNYCMGMGALM